MIKTEYVCDKCKVGQTTPHQFWTISIAVKMCNAPTYPASPVKEQHWCRKCAESMGLLPHCTNEVNLVTPPPTLEDLVRAIVQQEFSAGL